MKICDVSFKGPKTVLTLLDSVDRDLITNMDWSPARIIYVVQGKKQGTER